jgi:DNA-binding LytR/AlgR family response regulator
MKVLIVDDEMPARKQVRHLLEKNFSPENIVCEADNGEEAIKIISSEVPDVVFLDIHLHDMSGLDIASFMVENGINSKVVFITAYDKYALKAFEYYAVDYLLKPIEEDRFIKTIAKVEESFKSKALDSHSPNSISIERLLREHLQKEHTQSKITLERDDRFYVLSVLDIIYIETEDRNTKLATKKGVFRSNLNLCQWLDKLPNEKFFRTHRSFIVNTDEIEEVVLWFNNSLQLKMRGIKDTNIPISRGNLKSFKELMGIQP